MEKIIFHPSSKEHSWVVPPPKPASSYKADWWEKAKAFSDSSDIYNNTELNLTVKHCVPVRDALFSGYIQESWQDIRFDISDGGNNMSYKFPIDPPILSHRNQSSLPVGDEYHPIEFTVFVPWMPSMPPGWSVLITQPFNRPDLPFYSPAGIVDADRLNNTSGASNFPIYLRKDAPPVIRTGTPLYQIIPFKREDWQSELAEYNEEAHIKIWSKLRESFWGGYKKHYWVKKQYL